MWLKLIKKRTFGKVSKIEAFQKKWQKGIPKKLIILLKKTAEIKAKNMTKVIQEMDIWKTVTKIETLKKH